MQKLLQVFFTIFSAFILGFAIPNEFLHFGSPILGFFALVPLYVALRNADGLKNRSFLVGLHCSAVNLISSFWLINFQDFAIFTLGAPTVAYFFWGAFFGMCMHFIFSAAKKNDFLNELSGKNSGEIFARIFGFASVWTLWEWSKSIGFLAYPWGTLVMTTSRFPIFEQIADLTGTWGISFLLSLFSAIFGEWLCEKSEVFFEKSFSKRFFARCAVFYVFLFFAVIFYGKLKLENLPKKIGSFNAMIVQQNVDPWEGGGTYGLEASEKLTQKCKNESQKDFDIVLWSESSLNYSLPRSLEFYAENPESEPFLPFIKKIGAPFLVGGPVVLGEDAFNSVNYFDENGEWQGFYAKMQLVPFAEIIPGQEYAWVRKFLDALIGFSRGWTQGREWTIFPLSTKNCGEVNFSAPICFEDAFPSICGGLRKAGSDVFINLTNDSWSRTISAELQHFVIAHFRAIEFRTTLVRSTNAGYSCVVAPDGKTLFDLPLFQEAAEIAEIPVFERTETLYSRFGDWFPKVLSIFCFWIVLKKWILVKKDECRSR